MNNNSTSTQNIFEFGNTTVGPTEAIHDEIERRADVIVYITYVSASVSILGIFLTLISYIGYKKFRVKRTHSVMLNLCVCLLLYYLAYIVSNPLRIHIADKRTANNNSTENDGIGICAFSAFICHLSSLGTFFWITCYWFVLLVMHQRPMGGHISHFYIKAAVPSYGLSLMISITCLIVAEVKNDVMEEIYLSSQCFISNNYMYFGLLLPCVLLLIPIVVCFVIILRGLLQPLPEDGRGASQRSGLKSHFIKLTVLTVLFSIVIASSIFLPELKNRGDPTYISIVVFSIVSTGMGFVLMILFCVHQKEIRHHWVTVARGENVTMRNGRTTKEGRLGINGTNRESNSHHVPSVYLNSTHLADERKSSTIRMMPKQDTDMTTLNLVKIPGTPSPSRTLDEDSNRKSMNVTEKQEQAESETLLRKKKQENRKSHAKIDKHSTKRQQSVDQLIHNKPSKHGTGSRIVTRFTRKSVRSVSDAEDTVPITSADS